MPRCLRPSFIFLTACVLLGGCSEPEGVVEKQSPEKDVSGQGTNNDDEKIVQIEKVSGEKLNVQMGIELEYLDGGRLKLASPEGWKPLPRNKGYVTGFYLLKKTDFPRILITVEESQIEQMRDVTSENVREFTKQIASQLIEANKKLLQPPVPMILGDRPCARYIIAGKSKNIMLERQILKTLVGGRLYTIELFVFPKEIDVHHLAAYAVAASMKFKDPDEEEIETDPGKLPNG